MVLANENKTTNEEELEYESDEDEDFEKQYVESQMGPNFNSIVGSYNNDDNHEEGETEESNHEEGNHLGSEYEDYDFSEDNEENKEEETNETKNGELGNNLEPIVDLHTQQRQNNTGENVENSTQQSSNELGTTENENENETEKDGKNNNNILTKTKIKEIIDPFDDDELIEYVDDSNDDNNEMNDNNDNRTNDSDNNINNNASNRVLDDEFKGSDNSENKQVAQSVENIIDDNDDDNDNIIDFPIYLDFCEPFSTSNNDTLEVKWLDNKIKVNFDFMKLYQSRYKEDEIYSEIDILYNNLKDCIDLTFNDILFKIKEVIIDSTQEINIDEIDIHLTFSDLINLSISSDSVFSESLTLREVLKVYENLKIQSPNADLYKFLSIKVSITRNLLGQLRILNQASLNGYRLENLSSIVTNKRLYEDTCDKEGDVGIDEDVESKRIRFE